MNFIDNIDKIKQTFKHKKAFIYTEKRIYGKLSIAGILHDIDKVFLYCVFPKEKVKTIHRNNSHHHNKASSYDDYKQMVIDWECARITKPDKPLNAYQTLLTYYPSLISDILPILEEYNLVTN